MCTPQCVSREMVEPKSNEFGIRFCRIEYQHHFVSKILMGHFLKNIFNLLTDGVGDADRQGSTVLAMTKRVQSVCSLSRLRYEEADIVPGERDERLKILKALSTPQPQAPKFLLSAMHLLHSCPP